MQALFFGILFGFLLSRVGATDFDAIAGMFLLEDLHLAGVMAVAIVVAGLAIYWLRRRGVVCPSGCPVTLAPKAMTRHTVTGGIIFGAGWALTGSCPGTSLAQIGEGRPLSLFTVAGIVLGVVLFRRVTQRARAPKPHQPPSERKTRVLRPAQG